MGDQHDVIVTLDRGAFIAKAALLGIGAKAAAVPRYGEVRAVAVVADSSVA